MPSTTLFHPWWAAMTVWAVVNAVNLLQAIGFASRITTGNQDLNRALGYGIAGLALPALVALVALVRARAGWLHAAGPCVFIAFVALMLVVDYCMPVEFRSPARPAILVPYLLLSFGAILLMGLPMYRLHRGLWLVTAATTVLLLASMGVAMRRGVA